MSSITEQFSAAGKAQLTAQLNLLNALASQAVHNAEQVIALNLNAGKASLTQSAEAARHLFDSKDPRSLFTGHNASLEPLLAYSRQLFSIVSNAQSELMKSAKEHLSAASEPAKAAPVLTIAAPAVPVAAAPVAAAPAPEPVPAPAAEPAPVVEAKPVAKEEPKPEVKAEVKADSKPEAETKAAPAKPAAKPAAKAATLKQADLLSTKTRK